MKDPDRHSALCAPLALLALATTAGFLTAQEPAQPKPKPKPKPQYPTADPELSGYVAIDNALFGEYIVHRDEVWSYFPGTKTPAPELVWAQPDYDDSAWAKGPAAFGAGEGEYATEIPGMGDTVTTVYLRKHVNVPDSSIYERIFMYVPIDDGYTFYINGTVESWLGAGREADKPLAYDFVASTERAFDTPPTPTVDLSTKLVRGDNVFAFHGLIHPDDLKSFKIEPRVFGRFNADPDRERKRFERLRALLAPDATGGTGGNEAHLSYLEGRYLQRVNRPADALPFFRKTTELDPEPSYAWHRWVECARALGELHEFESQLRARIDGGEFTSVLLNTWAEIWLDELLGTPLETTALSLAGAAPEAGRFADALWVAEELQAGRALRVDAGAAGGREEAGIRWSRDRFAQYGTASEIERGSGSGLWRGVLDGNIRVADRPLNKIDPLYRIPLPPGPYELRLLFVADGQERVGNHVFDIRIQDGVARADYDTEANAGRRGTDVHRYPVLVQEFLRFDLAANVDALPILAGWEVIPLSPEDYQRLASAWVEDTERQLPLALVQLAESQRILGDDLGALELYEEAARLEGFRARDVEALAELRDGLLPDLAHFAAVDDLLRRRAPEAEQLLAQARSGGASDDLTLYLDGRTHQLAGRIDDALAAFEELVASGVTAHQPTLRMAECLAAVGLGEEAEAFLRDGLDSGVDPDPALVQMWISLNLGVLRRDPWDVVAELDRFDLPDELVIVPHSAGTPREWLYTMKEPPATTWSRTTFNASSWNVGLGGIGAGQPPFGLPRSRWDTRTVFARRSFQLTSYALLYPHLRVFFNDAGDVYLNGLRISRVSVNTLGYALMPARDGSFVNGENILGMYAYNVRGPAYADVGIVEPIDDLLWIWKQLQTEGVVRINCGGPEHVSPDGTMWAADRFFGWGQVNEVDRTKSLPEILETDDNELYYTQRWFYEDSDNTWYQIPLPNDSYRITLHFAEITEPEEGKRIFDVRIENELILERYDPVARVGFQTADVRWFDADVNDGWLDLRLSDKTYRSVISAVEIKRKP